MMYRGYGMFGWGGILVLILIIIVAYFLVKHFTENKNKSNTFREKDNAIDILNERYAKGEIDEEEYLKRKKALRE
jgi:putative membrane protein